MAFKNKGKKTFVFEIVEGVDETCRRAIDHSDLIRSNAAHGLGKQVTWVKCTLSRLAIGEAFWRFSFLGEKARLTIISLTFLVGINSPVISQPEPAKSHTDTSICSGARFERISASYDPVTDSTTASAFYAFGGRGWLSRKDHVWS